VKLPRQARWAVPAGAVAAVGIVIAGSVIAGAQTTPRLPARTSAQLLAAVDDPPAVPSAMTAVVQETASLGLPDLPGSSDPLSALSLLSGTHTFQIWYDGPSRVRVAVPVSLGETDLRRDGRSAWLWDSRTNQATHYLLPAASTGPARSAPPPDAPGGSIPTPQQLARQILAEVGPTTTVGLQQNVTVAGRAAYQLSLAPKDGRSLIGQVRIAVDASDSLPLRVQVFARGASGPAFTVGFTSLSFAVPAASNFTFSPPPGARVKTVTVPAGVPRAPGAPVVAPGAPPFPAATSGPGAQPAIEVSPSAGNGKVTLRAINATSPATARQIEALFASTLPASLSRARRAALIKLFAASMSAGKPVGNWVGTTLPAGSSSSASSSVAFSSGPASSAPAMPLAALAGSAPGVMGRGWLSVAVLTPASYGYGGAAPTGAGPPVPSASLGVLSALESAATPVHGAWGSGRLLRTSLLSVLMTDQGTVLIGAVVPSVLYADAARLG
jgi:outer membrane lipoprotein-sorting protein